MSAPAPIYSQHKNSRSSPATSAHQNTPAPASAASPPAAPVHLDPSYSAAAPNSPATPHNSRRAYPLPQSSPPSSRSRTAPNRPHARACRPPQSHSPATARASLPNTRETSPRNLPAQIPGSAPAFCSTNTLPSSAAFLFHSHRSTHPPAPPAVLYTPAKSPAASAAGSPSPPPLHPSYGSRTSPIH